MVYMAKTNISYIGMLELLQLHQIREVRGENLRTALVLQQFLLQRCFIYDKEISYIDYYEKQYNKKYK